MVIFVYILQPDKSQKRYVDLEIHLKWTSHLAGADLKIEKKIIVKKI